MFASLAELRFDKAPGRSRAPRSRGDVECASSPGSACRLPSGSHRASVSWPARWGSQQEPSTGPDARDGVRAPASPCSKHAPQVHTGPCAATCPPVAHRTCPGDGSCKFFHLIYFLKLLSTPLEVRFQNHRFWVTVDPFWGFWNDLCRSSDC